MEALGQESGGLGQGLDSVWLLLGRAWTALPRSFDKAWTAFGRLLDGLGQ